jgi:succinyl-diaminopimelate desuccinylase
MKTSIAAFAVAAQQAIESKKSLKGSIALLITSDEEGPAIDGTVKVVSTLKARGEIPDFCIVGEPSCANQLGDTLKNGRRGSLSGRLIIQGVQGHIAYPDLAKNPIHLIAPALAELVNTVWDQRPNPYFPPTSWQISNIHAGTGANNVIPAELSIDFNFRFSTESTPETLQARFEDVLKRYKLSYTLHWNLSGMPFLTPKGRLSEVLTKAIFDHTGVTPQLSTTGGTSDGRFIAQICPQVIEFGPPNTSIHKIDEHIEVACIEPLTNIYRTVILELLTE